ncbi:MAG: DNA recombination protein RmuC [Candidatus Aminicenantes bacterium]|nr:DNA recombination protein RmuC [Candidatus Aminicenantes bacterium]
MSLIEIAGIVLIVLALTTVILLLLIVRRRPDTGWSSLSNRLDAIERGQERGERELRDEFVRNREESTGQMSSLRREVAANLKGVADSVTGQITGLTQVQQGRLDAFGDRLEKLIEANERKGDALRTVVETRLLQLQTGNEAKLEEMRRTVDEKLQTTLEKRLGDSFKQVSDRLELVHKGLGEMQTLASGVGDLKKVLSNVKTRGTWGEIQLGNLLEQILTPDQFDRNVPTKEGSADRVEFAVKLPGRGNEPDKPFWLPIDAKFPKEEYERLLTAAEQGNADAVEESGRKIEAQIKIEAKKIQEKYLDPPRTTDFGLMFLPTEGLYAEVLRRDGLTDVLQRDYRVVVAGPTTLLAILNSLQMGFQSLAIEKRSAEIRELLGAVKTEFGKFGDVIEKVHKKITEAGDVIDKAKIRSRAIERRLRTVEELPAGRARGLLSGAEAEWEAEADEKETAVESEETKDGTAAPST